MQPFDLAISFSNSSCFRPYFLCILVIFVVEYESRPNDWLALLAIYQCSVPFSTYKSLRRIKTRKDDRGFESDD